MRASSLRTVQSAFRYRSIDAEVRRVRMTGMRQKRTLRPRRDLGIRPLWALLLASGREEPLLMCGHRTP